MAPHVLSHPFSPSQLFLRPPSSSQLMCSLLFRVFSADLNLFDVFSPLLTSFQVASTFFNLSLLTSSHFSPSQLFLLYLSFSHLTSGLLCSSQLFFLHPNSPQLTSSLLIPSWRTSCHAPSNLSFSQPFSLLTTCISSDLLSSSQLFAAHHQLRTFWHLCHQLGAASPPVGRQPRSPKT